MADYRFRLAGDEDAETVHEMVCALAESIGLRHKVRAGAESYRRPDDAFVGLLAETGSKAVGLSLYFRTFSSWLGQPGVYIQDLFVAETERGRGLGRALVEETAERARQSWGAAYLSLAVDRNNLGAMQFYQSIGMSPNDSDRLFMARDGAFERLLQGPGT